jgi:hypothetical protein
VIMDVREEPGRRTTENEAQDARNGEANAETSVAYAGSVGYAGQRRLTPNFSVGQNLHGVA